MGRGRVKIIRPKGGLGDFADEVTGDDDIVNMFSKMMGDGAPPPLPVAWGKWKDARAQAERFVRLCNNLAESALWKKLSGLERCAASIIDFTRTLREHPFFALIDLEKVAAGQRAAARAGTAATDGARSSVDLPEALLVDADPLRGVTKEAVEEFYAAYETLSQYPPVGAPIVACAQLEAHSAALKDAAALKGRFLSHSAGMMFAPLPPPGDTVNFKAAYNHPDAVASDRNYILFWLHKALEIGERMNEILSRPDIDMDQFVNVIGASLDQVSRQPGMDRCGKAFKRIRDSMDLLRGNFSEYYKDIQESGNPSLLMENFIVDIVKKESDSDEGLDPSEAVQLKKIVAKYRRMASEKQNLDPRMRNLLEKADRGLGHLQKEFTADTGTEVEIKPVEEPAAPAAEPVTEEPPAKPTKAQKTRAKRLRRQLNEEVG